MSLNVKITYGYTYIDYGGKSRNLFLFMYFL